MVDYLSLDVEGMEMKVSSINILMPHNMSSVFLNTSKIMVLNYDWSLNKYIYNFDLRVNYMIILFPLVYLSSVQYMVFNKMSLLSDSAYITLD